MKIEQSFGPTPMGGVWYQYTAHIDGEQLAVRKTVEQRGYAPIEFIMENMKRQIMREIERRLFRGVM